MAEDPSARILAAETPEEVRSIASELAESAAKIEIELSATKRARELLLNSVAHDLRNPLNTFAMSVGLMKEDLERNDLDATRALSLVKRMERSTLKMQSLVEDLLEASRVEARAVELTPRNEAAATVADKAAASMSSQGEERRVRITVGDADRSLRVNVDLERTTQAVAKLLSYVLKHTGEGGAITLDVTGREGAVLFVLRSMPPQGAPSSAPLDAGRGGLALLIGRGLIEAQEGTVEVETDSISIRLPSAG